MKVQVLCQATLRQTYVEAGNELIMMTSILYCGYQITTRSTVEGVTKNLASPSGSIIVGTVFHWPILLTPTRKVNFLRVIWKQACLGPGLFSYFRNCGKVFCDSCCNDMTPVPSEQLYDPVRVCKTCFEKLHVGNGRDIVVAASWIDVGALPTNWGDECMLSNATQQMMECWKLGHREQEN